MNAERNDIWDINFSPSIGAEIKKIRPGVVMNLSIVGRLPLYIVVPITEWKNAYQMYPWIVFIEHT